MVTKNDLISYFKQHPERGYYNEENNTINILYADFDNDIAEYPIDADEYLDKYRKLSGESFEFVYGDECNLMSVFLCTECKTMLITHDDERYEPDLKCPVCTDFNPTYSDFITIRDTKDNKDAKEVYDMYINLGKDMEEMFIREKRRGGKHDYQLCIYVRDTLNKKVTYELQCDNVVKSRIKGLRLSVLTLDKVSGEIKYKMIPLGLTSLYVDFIKPKKYKRKKNEEDED